MGEPHAAAATVPHPCAPSLLLGMRASRQLQLFLFCPFHNPEALFPPSPSRKIIIIKKKVARLGWREGSILLSPAALWSCLSHSFSPCPNPALSFRNDVQVLRARGGKKLLSRALHGLPRNLDCTSDLRLREGAEGQLGSRLVACRHIFSRLLLAGANSMQGERGDKQLPLPAAGLSHLEFTQVTRSQEPLFCFTRAAS